MEATTATTLLLNIASSSTRALTTATRQKANNYEHISEDLILPFAVLFLSIVVIGLLGNTFVALVVITDRKLLNSSVNLFLLNLAVADMGNLIFCSPDAVMLLRGQGWALPDASCPLVRFLQEYFLYSSVLMQMSIGIERYMAICSPLRMQRFSKRTSILFISGVWLIAALFAFPYFVFSSSFTVNGTTYCVWSSAFRFKNLYRYAETLVLYVFPLFLLTVLYTIMSAVLWGKETAIANEVQQLAILKLRRSVVKMLIISMLIYFICYSPPQVMIVHNLLTSRRVNLSINVKALLNAFSLSSSSANPIVYIMCCRHFHQRFTGAIHYLKACICPHSATYRAVLDPQAVNCNSRSFSRSPYVSFRRSVRRTSQTLL